MRWFWTSRASRSQSERSEPVPGKEQVLIEVSACAVCRTDLHIFDGELTEPKLPLPGHMIVGRVAGGGEGAVRFADGDRIGVPWLGWTDGTCRYCRSGRENLCVQGSTATTSTAATPSARSPTSASASRSRTTPMSTRRRCSARD